MGFSRTAFVNLLRSQTGYHEGRDPSGNWNNDQKFSDETPGLEWSDWQAWCATFTAWGANKLGARSLWPITASCYTAVQWWKKAGRWTEYPVLGGPFYLGSAGQDHVGVVTAYDADWIWTVEGNTNSGGSYQGDGVYERKRPRRGAGSPYGYGIPQFDEGTISADPALGGTKAASVPKKTSTTTPPTTTTTPPKETPVTLTEYEMDRIATKVTERLLNTRLESPTAAPGTDPTRRLSTFIRWADQNTADILAAVDEVKAEVASLKEAQS
ncbi:hypothetical protein EAO71_20205 [Streptomyces sp. ms191]|uniref:CHAP domain-containing protein n=1 Tax=Streptomyces sp. ms191 TaxID=1827978 RepID=UPI0011CED1DA|nr:CHAP domain-containing protein [Streptomyces sp. ms191]TXS30721.1 hypothetical protein EAO71_20205 [Streptomyces sp. ms191]